MSATQLTNSEKEILGGKLTKHNSYLSNPDYVTFFNTCISPAAAKLDDIKSQAGDKLYKQRVHAALLKELKIGGR